VEVVGRKLTVDSEKRKAKSGDWEDRHKWVSRIKEFFAAPLGL